eukprot:23669-Chlamydomonas_euryale.AAC.1
MPAFVDSLAAAPAPSTTAGSTCGGTTCTGSAGRLRGRALRSRRTCTGESGSYHPDVYGQVLIRPNG